MNNANEKPELNTAKANRAMLLAKLEAVYARHGLIYAAKRAEAGLPADLLLGIVPNWRQAPEVPAAIDARDLYRAA